MVAHAAHGERLKHTSPYTCSTLNIDISVVTIFANSQIPYCSHEVEYGSLNTLKSVCFKTGSGVRADPLWDLRRVRESTTFTPLHPAPVHNSGFWPVCSGGTIKLNGARTNLLTSISTPPFQTPDFMGTHCGLIFLNYFELAHVSLHRPTRLSCSPKPCPSLGSDIGSRLIRQSPLPKINHRS